MSADTAEMLGYGRLALYAGSSEPNFDRAPKERILHPNAQPRLTEIALIREAVSS
jgi:hypothetical protein